MKTATTVALLSVPLLASACGDPSGSANLTAVAVNVEVEPPPSAFAQDACGNTLGSAQLVIRRLRLDGEEPNDGPEIDATFGPFLVDLTAADFNGAFHQAVLQAQLPAGTYDRARFDMHKIDEDEAGSDPALQAMADADVSVLVHGTSGGGAFTFSTDVNDEQEIAVALEVGNAVTGLDEITLSVDPSGWFGEAGACLDPAADVDAIEENIRASVDLEEES